MAAGAALFAADRPAPVTADEAPAWNPFFHTLDLLLPVVSLGPDGAWRPDGAARWAAYAFVLAGWVLAGVAAAAATRVIDRG